MNGGTDHEDNEVPVKVSGPSSLLGFHAATPTVGWFTSIIGRRAGLSHIMGHLSARAEPSYPAGQPRGRRTCVGPKPYPASFPPVPAGYDPVGLTLTHIKLLTPAIAWMFSNQAHAAR